MYKVYILEFPNGKLYIGQTCQSAERRWRRGDGYKECPYVFKAIKKYGWDNVKHYIIADGLSHDQADQLEIELIEKYNTTDRRDGYNIQHGGGITRGGFHNTQEHNDKISISKSKAVDCYTLDGEFVGTFDSATIAAKVFGLNSQDISNVRNGKQMTAGGYVWRFNGMPFDQYSTEILVPSRSRKVICLDKDDNIIAEYISISEAERETGIKHQCIGRACRGERKTAGKLKWKYAESEKGNDDE